MNSKYVTWRSDMNGNIYICIYIYRVDIGQDIIAFLDISTLKCFYDKFKSINLSIINVDAFQK